MTEKTKEKTIYEVLHDIQVKLKAPKGQTNKFGGYKYRNCEDILEAVKPLLPKGCVVLLNDNIVEIGGRFYIKARAGLECGCNGKSSGVVNVEAYAREPLTRKGMDESQITGAASSYARKYALNGLFCIDDTRDADSGEPTKESSPKKTDAQTFNPITADEYQGLFNGMSVCKTRSRLEEIIKELGKLKPRMDKNQAKTLGEQLKATQVRLDNQDLENNMDKAGE